MISGRRHQAIVRDLAAKHDRERRVWESERGCLLDRIMYLAGSPWGLPESDVAPEPEPDLEDEFDLTPEAALADFAE
ncbi:MAG: hypothetical protein H0V07_06255 [Propionibacteriales bacterium]|nr:hypothetical protein [Propionibacteriales bacterium]